MALIEPYCTVADADVYLASSADWTAATTAEKEQALFWGRVWIDSNMRCQDLRDDPTNPSDEVKYANALLAEDYLQGTLLDTGTTTTPVTGIKRSKQKAGSVETETEYFDGATDGVVAVDHQQNVKMLLAGECSVIAASMRRLDRN